MFRRAGMALWVDLRERDIDLWSVLDGTGAHSATEALAVAEALPDTTRTYAALAGDPAAQGWGADRELLLLLVNSYRDEKDRIKSPMREAKEREARIAELSTPEAIMALLG